MTQNKSSGEGEITVILKIMRNLETVPYDQVGNMIQIIFESPNLIYT